MAQKKRVIFKVNDLEKNFGSYEALKIKKLEIHPGTIYGIIGTVGSGKSTLLNILAGTEKQSSGTVLYEDQPYERDWLGRIKLHDEIFYSKSPLFNKLSKTVAMELIANGQAVAGATKVTKKKAAKAKPVVNAER